MKMECDPHYDTQADYEPLGEDEPDPGSTRISRPDDICPETLRDPNAGTYDWDSGADEPLESLSDDDQLYDRTDHE